MKIEDLIEYIGERMPHGIAKSMMPLIISQSRLDELVDGTELTAEQCVAANNAGILIVPDDFEYYPAT